MSFINGAFAETDAPQMAVVNPATGGTIGQVPMSRPQDMVRAIDAADAAFASWGETLAAERELILIRMADALEQHRAELVDLLIDEAGSTFGKACFEVEFTASMLRSASGEARRIFGHVIPSDAPGCLSFTLRRPLGVIGAIAPFNYPLLLGTKKVCMAIAAGNTVVMKPSEETSMIALKAAEVFQAAGLPPGVLNVVSGDGAILGGVLLSDPRVKMISFTGSTRVGRFLAVECARMGKKITLEMGGKSPVIVLDDADLDYAVETAAFGIFIHQGQICMAGSRIIVDEAVYEAFLDRFVAKVRQLKMGDPRQPDTVIGPLIRASQCVFIADVVATAVKGGARLMCGGRHEGNFFEPTVLADVTREMSVFKDELFGPVASVIKARDASHALALANDSCYGLSSAVLTRSLDKALHFARHLEAGVVHVNSSTIEDNPHAPFGGVKDSGMGREGGQWSMEEMTETKWVTIQQGRRTYPF